MKVNTEKNCTIIAALFFIVVTVIELALFGSLFDVFVSHWGRISAIVCTTVTFNAAIWFFAVKYRQTTRSIKNTQQ